MRRSQTDKPERDRASMPMMPEGGTREVESLVGRSKSASAGAIDGGGTGGPSEEEIRARAHEIYRERLRRGEPGDDRGDWARAERELREPMARGGGG